LTPITVLAGNWPDCVTALAVTPAEVRDGVGPDLDGWHVRQSLN
jgi:hypothetical protein